MSGLRLHNPGTSPSSGTEDGKSKLTDLPSAMRLIRDGDHVAVGGCLYSRTPMAALLEVLRQRRNRLTLSRSLMCYEADLFLVEGAAERIITSWVGIGIPWGVSRVVRHYVEEGLAEYEEWSHLALGLRYLAAAMGVPFLPTRSMLGSDLLAATDAKEINCPFTGQRLCLIPAMKPDVALIHVQRADALGNAEVDGSPYLDWEIARAADCVVVTAERIVETAEFRQHPERTLLPHFVVDAVVQVQAGAFPHECHGMYDADYRHFDEYVSRTRDRGIDGVRQYLEQFVHGPRDHQAFLAAVGSDRLEAAQRSAEGLVYR